MKGTPPNRGAGQRQTKATKAPSGGIPRAGGSQRGDPRSGKGITQIGGGSNAGAKRAPGTYDNTPRFAGNRGTGTGPGRQANFKRS